MAEGAQTAETRWARLLACGTPCTLMFGILSAACDGLRRLLDRRRHAGGGDGATTPSAACSTASSCERSQFRIPNSSWPCRPSIPGQISTATSTPTPSRPTAPSRILRADGDVLRRRTHARRSAVRCARRHEDTVSPDYFDLVGARLAAGRFFTDTDDPVVVISEGFRRRLSEMVRPSGRRQGRRRARRR